MKNIYKLFSNQLKNFGTLNMKAAFTVSCVIAFMFIIVTTSYAQDRTLSGTITDAASGESLPGTSIKIKGTTNGTTTDLDGNYKLQVAADDVLVISFIGYATEEVTVGSRSLLDVALDLDISQLSEVVVVGYGTSGRRKM